MSSQGSSSAPRRKLASKSTPNPKAPRAKALPLIDPSKVRSRKVDWLWAPYIPRGKLTMIDGDPGVMKSWITCELAAKISSGLPLHGQSRRRKAGRVLMLATEDEIADTIRPRLEAQGAHLDNITICTGSFTLDSYGTARLAATVEAWKPDLIIIDPIVSYVGPKLNLNAANEVRQIMDNIDTVVRAQNCACVIVRHTRKARTGSALDAGMGSRDFGAKIRSGLIAGRDGEGLYALAHYKASGAPRGMSLGYEIVKAPDTFLGVRLAWRGPVATTPDELVAGAAGRADKLAEAKAFLKMVLKNGTAPARKVIAAAVAEGIAVSTRKRAEVELGILKSRDGKERAWFWSLPE